MRMFFVLLTFLLAGCTTVPVTAKFPGAVPELMKSCGELKRIENAENVPITDLIKVIVHNYTLYHQCSEKVESWQEWHRTQKELFEQAK